MTLKEAEDAYVAAYAKWQSKMWDDKKSILHGITEWARLCDAARDLKAARESQPTGTSTG